MQILLCTDGSPHGQDALWLGAQLARQSPEPATLLGVVEETGDRPLIEQALEEGQHLLAGAPAPNSRIRQGHAAEQILEEAAEAEYDLIVVGSRGRRGLTRFLLGSTAERIARHAEQPVLIVHGERRHLSRILACTAAGKAGLVTVDVAGRVARLLDAQVTVLHIMSQLASAPDLDATLMEDLEAPADVLISHHTREGEHLEQALQILSSLGVDGQPRVRHGLVVDEILSEVCDGDYDLVVVGAHTTRGMMRFLVEDVTHKIIDQTDRPVLVARG
jgi:nucleotide-binding universal stress UspA family protein